MRKFLFALLLLAGAAGFGSPIRAAEVDPRVKVLLEEALRLYSENQYVRALDLFKQVQRIDPANETAKEYIPNVERKMAEWEQGGAGGKQDPTWDSLLSNKKRKSADTLSNAKDIIAARRSLVERMRNRSVNTENIVQIQDTKKGLEIVLFHDQLFLPGLQTLRDEALVVLENVAQLIRQKGDRDVTIQSLAHSNSKDPFLLYPDASPVPAKDRNLPQMKSDGTSFLFQDIEATRSFILFTYLAQRSMGVSSAPQR